MSKRLRVRRSGRALTGVATLVAIAGLTLAAGGSAAYDSGSSAAATTFDSPTGAWFVELSGSADSFRGKARASGLRFSERYEFKRLWNGLSVNADAGTAQLMAKLDGVAAVHPVGIVTLDPGVQADPELAHALAMTGADVAQSELGLTGDGVQVGVMDTGIDYDNPALGGCFGSGCRVTTGWDFVGDRFNSSGSGGAVIPHPDPDPDDCNGHGTHVSGIVGASGTVNGVSLTGVAPGVTFGAYRVFGCEGSTSEDIMIAAMERALADGMDVLNLSIGDAFAWDTEPLAEAMNGAVAEGMVVVISAGNSGTNGVYSLSSAGNARDVIGVASIDNSHVELNTFTVTPDGSSIGYAGMSGADPAPTSGSLPMSKTGTPGSGADACTAIQDDLTGTAVLIRRGGCTFRAKAENAMNAGAAAVIIYNNSPGRFAGTLGSPALPIVAVSISDAEGVLINDLLDEGAVTLTWTDEQGTFENATAGQPSSFTSWGLAPSLGLKPDIAAPGGLIKSTWPMEAGGFATISGTSMAAPHVSGAAALFIEAHGTTDPLVLREILQNNAVPSILPGTPFPNAVHRQGAGTLQIDDAILATTRVSPGKLALGEGSTAHFETITIWNNGTSDVTYDLSHQPAVGTRGSTFAPIQTGNFASATFSSSSVLVPAGGNATVDVTITPNTSSPLFDRSIYTGYIRLTPQGGGAPLRVPYGGFTGDYQTIQAIAPGACSFPGVFKADGSTTCGAATLNGWTRQTDGATYDVSEASDRPIVLYHLAHQSESLEIRAVDGLGEEFLVARSVLVERNPTNDLTPPGQSTGPGFFTYTWDGKAVSVNPKNGNVTRKALPDGVYKLRLVITKALAEPGNPAHVETVDLPTMNIVGGG